MMRGNGYAAALALTASVAALIAAPARAEAQAQVRQFDIPAQPLASALLLFSRQADQMVVAAPAMTAGKQSQAVRGALMTGDAIERLLSGSGLRARANPRGGFLVEPAPQAAAEPRLRPAAVRRAEVQPAPDLAAPAEEVASQADIVVTAQRRSELSRDVPIAITSVGADMLQQANVRQLTDLSKLTPGVKFNGSAAFIQPSIRGVSTSLVGSGVGSNVGIYVDGFYSTTSTGSNFQLLNVRSIEVLKGPQGTLFGRNTTGGAIQVTTAAPQQEPSAVAEVSYGRFDAQRYQAYATAGLAEGIAIDAEGLYSRGDGYVRNIATGGRKDGAYENWSARFGVKLDPSDTVSILLRYQHSDVKDPTALQANAFVENGVPLTIGNIIPGTVIATRPGQVAGTQDQYFRLKTDTVQLTVKADLGFADLSSYSQYRKDRSESLSDLDYSGAPVFFLSVPQRSKLFTQELILASHPGSPLQWTAGAFFLDEKNSFPASEATLGGPYLLIARTGLHARSIALFGDATYAVSDKLFVTAGVRYSNERAYDAFRDSGPLSGGLGLTQYPTLDRNYVTPRVVVRYKPDDSSSIYASITQGMKAAIIDTNDSIGLDPIKKEKLTAYEIGYKYGSRRFSVDLAAYYYDYKNLQVSIPVATALLVRNAANSRIYGAEAQMRYDAGGGFELSAGASYTNAKYRDFTDSQVFNQCLDFATCGADFGLFPNAVASASGFQMQLAPEFTATINPSYTTRLADGRLRLSANLFYTSSFYFDTSQQFRQSGYATLGLRAEWTDPSDRFTLAVYGDNVTDKRYRIQVVPNNFGVGGVWSAPVTWGVSLRAKL